MKFSKPRRVFYKIENPIGSVVSEILLNLPFIFRLHIHVYGYTTLKNDSLFFWTAQRFADRNFA